MRYVYFITNDHIKGKLGSLLTWTKKSGKKSLYVSEVKSDFFVVSHNTHDLIFITDAKMAIILSIMTHH